MAVPQLYGAIYLTGIPLDGRRAANVLDDSGLIGHADGVWIDIASMTAATLTIPWITNSQWFDLRATGLSNRIDRLNDMMSLKIICAGVFSISTAIPKSVTVNTWVTLHGVELAGPIDPVALSTLADDSADANEITPYPSTDIEGKYDRYEAGQISNIDIEDDSGTVDPYVDIDQNGDPILDAPLELQSGLEQLFYDSANAVGNSIKTEVVKESSAFLTSAMKRGFHQADKWMGDWFDFDDTWVDKEPAATPQTPTQPAENNVNIANNPVGSMISSPNENALGRQAMVLGRISDHSLKDWMAVPSFMGQFFPAYGSPEEIQTRPFDVDTGRQDLTSCDRMTFVSRFFRYWRGTWKVLFQVHASPFFVSKINVTLAWNTTIPKIGNTINHTFTVKGFMTFAIEIPYLFDNPYQPTSAMDDQYFPQLRVQLLSVTKAAGDVAPTPMILMYKVPCDDFEFYSQCDPRWRFNKITFPEGEIEAQCSLAALAKVQPETSYRVNYSPLLCPPKEELTWESLIRRWDQGHIQPQSYAYHIRSGDPPSAFRSISLIDIVSGLFMFRRGSYKLRVKFTDGVAKKLYLIMNDPRAPINTTDPEIPTSPEYKRTTNGVHMIDVGLTHFTTVTIPFLATTDWFETYLLGSSRLGEMWQWCDWSVLSENDTTPSMDFYAIQAGDDFHYSYSLPPPQPLARAWGREFAYSSPS